MHKVIQSPPLPTTHLFLVCISFRYTMKCHFNFNQLSCTFIKIQHLAKLSTPPFHLGHHFGGCLNSSQRFDNNSARHPQSAGTYSKLTAIAWISAWYSYQRIYSASHNNLNCIQISQTTFSPSVKMSPDIPCYNNRNSNFITEYNLTGSKEIPPGSYK